jgi:hypothetical protein
VEKADLTWGLDDPGLVGLGRVAVPLPVRQALHHGVGVAVARFSLRGVRLRRRWRRRLKPWASKSGWMVPGANKREGAGT